MQTKTIIGQLLAAVWITLAVTSCDEGLIVPDEELAGAISGRITYVNGVDWPPDSTIFDIRFVALRFFPVDTADFLQLNRMEISNTLRRGVATDTFFIDDVAPGLFQYSGVAYQFSEDIFDWRPVGVYRDGASFTVANGETAHVAVTVDFDNPPIFPPDL